MKIYFIVFFCFSNLIFCTKLYAQVAAPFLTNSKNSYGSIINPAVNFWLMNNQLGLNYFSANGESVDSKGWLTSLKINHPKFSLEGGTANLESNYDAGSSGHTHYQSIRIASGLNKFAAGFEFSPAYYKYYNDSYSIFIEEETNTLGGSLKINQLYIGIAKATNSQKDRGYDIDIMTYGLGYIHQKNIQFHFEFYFVNQGEIDYSPEQKSTNILAEYKNKKIEFSIIFSQKKTYYNYDIQDDTTVDATFGYDFSDSFNLAFHRVSTNYEDGDTYNVNLFGINYLF